MLLFLTSMLCLMNAQSVKSFKYVLIESQKGSPKDVEERLYEGFTELGFKVIKEEDYDSLQDSEPNSVLLAKYRCRQSGSCIFKLQLYDKQGTEVYEDEQICANGFMSRRLDRRGAISRIFKQLQKELSSSEDKTN